MSEARENPEISTRKRKFEDDESAQENGSKRKLLEDVTQQVYLLDLADEILMEILKTLDGESLHALSATCSKLKNLIEDKTLWMQAVFTSKQLDIWDIFKRLRYLKMTTKTLRIKGNCTRENIDERPMPNRETFKEIIKRIIKRSPLIQHLHFEKLCFDWMRHFSISKFPANLKSLTFQNCIMPKTRGRRMIRLFSGIVEHMPQLQELRLEYCNFFESNDVMPFSKLQHLETLSLRGCGKMRNCVPYLSLACRFGFPKLKVLDLRETNISDGELQCLNAIKSLRELFLEHPEMECWNDSEDDDFELMLRGPRRPHPSRDQSGNASEEPQVSAPRASTSRVSAAPEPPINISPPSSPETFSDSVSSSSSDPEDSPLRTIVIRANINHGDNHEGMQPRISVIFGGDAPHARRYIQLGRNHDRPSPLDVSDRGMLGFGFPRQNLVGNLVFFGNQPPDPNTQLERIILRNFRNITDTTISHLETNAPRLTFLDVRGCTQITREAVGRFKVARSECELLSNYDNEE